MKTHPFDKWLNRKKFILIQGKHYTCRPYSMSIQLRNAAHRRNKRVRVMINGDTLRVTVLESNNA